MRHLITTLVLAAGVCIANHSSAQTATSNVSTGTALSGIANDTVATNFIAQASLGNLKEIEAGKLALQKSKQANVRAFAAMMIKDHTKAGADMNKVLLSKRFVAPKPPAASAAPDAMLTNASGNKFDINYITMMYKDHVKTIQLFEHAAAKVKDPSLKAFAVKTLPILKEHLSMDKQIEAKLNIKPVASR